MNYHAKWGADDVFRDAAALRTEVFVNEQRFCEEFDDIDKTALHMVLYDQNGQPAATGRLFEEHTGVFRIGRICARKCLRGCGLGRTVVTELEKKAISLGATCVVLGAQTRVRGFYEALGYRACGEEYNEEHCPHIPMAKTVG